MVPDLADLRKPKPNPKPVTEKLRTNPIYISFKRHTISKYQVPLKLEAKEETKIRIWWKVFEKHTPRIPSLPTSCCWATREFWSFNLWRGWNSLWISRCQAHTENSGDGHSLHMARWMWPPALMLSLALELWQPHFLPLGKGKRLESSFLGIWPAQEKGLNNINIIPKTVPPCRNSELTSSSYSCAQGFQPTF